MELSRESLLLYLGEQLGVDTDGVADETPLFSSNLLDSFNIVELITFIETRAGMDGVVMTFPDFVPGVTEFGERIMPLMTTRPAQALSGALT